MDDRQIIEFRDLHHHQISGNAIIDLCHNLFADSKFLPVSQSAEIADFLRRCPIIQYKITSVPTVRISGAK